MNHLFKKNICSDIIYTGIECNEVIKMEKIIFHVDVNSAYLSWEAVYRRKYRGETLDLRDIPSAVGGDVNQRQGIILAKSMPAKAYGIRTGDSVWEARQKYGPLMIVPRTTACMTEVPRPF